MRKATDWVIGLDLSVAKTKMMANGMKKIQDKENIANYRLRREGNVFTVSVCSHGGCIPAITWVGNVSQYPGQGGCGIEGNVCPGVSAWGCLPVCREGCLPDTPTEMATVLVGTHPTGMDTC